MAHLYELKNEFNQVWNLIDEADEMGIDDQTILDTLEGIQGDIKEKAIAIACVIKDLNNDVSAYAAEEKRLAEKRKSIEKRIESLKNYLKDGLIASGVDKVNDTKASIRFMSRTATKIDNESEFIQWCEENNRDDLLSYKASISKTAVKDSLDMGAELPGASIVTNTSIIIK